MATGLEGVGVVAVALKERPFMITDDVGQLGRAKRKAGG